MATTRRCACPRCSADCTMQPQTEECRQGELAREAQYAREGAAEEAFVTRAEGAWLRVAEYDPTEQGVG